MGTEDGNTEDEADLKIQRINAIRAAGLEVGDLVRTGKGASVVGLHEPSLGRLADRDTEVGTSFQSFSTYAGYGVSENMVTPKYGDLIRLGTGDGEALEVLRRVPLGAGTSEGSVSEDDLRRLLFRFPETLPIVAIDATYAGAVPICQELHTPAGFIDALYVNPLGRIILTEFKLWRNPQARREVIGQILDYAKELASWSYEDLQRQVSIALNQSGNILIDNVTRHLRRGEFLLLIVGDGIQEGVANIVDFVQRHSGLHFNLALVEAALYRDSANHLIVQPRVLARIEIVQRFVVDSDFVRQTTRDDIEIEDDTLSDQEEGNLQFWRPVVRDYSLADTTVATPTASKDSTLYVQVRGSGFGDWGLCFDGYLQRNVSRMGCFLMARRDQSQAVRIFDELVSSLDEWKVDLGEDLEFWNNDHGRPRLGFRRQESLSFLIGSESDDEYVRAVSWMRHHLNRLVSGLHPHIQSMLAEVG